MTDKVGESQPATERLTTVVTRAEGGQCGARPNGVQPWDRHSADERRFYADNMAELLGRHAPTGRVAV